MRLFDIHQLFGDLINETRDKGNQTLPLSQVRQTSTGIRFIFSWNPSLCIRETFIEVSKDVVKSAFPRWNGINLELTDSLQRNGKMVDGHYIVLSQVPEYDSDGVKYETIICDLVLTLNGDGDLTTSSKRIAHVLNKWKLFFSSANKLNPSKENQQGLFGELLFLKYLVEIYGSTAVYWWQGPSAVSHDFAIPGKIWVEVKTTGKKAPYSVTISSEYQLDYDTTSDEKLYLAVYPVEQNVNVGTSVPQLVSEIRSMLRDEDCLAEYQFNRILGSAGYHDTFSEYYNLKFILREGRLLYYVDNDFPRINREEQHIPSAVGSISYTLSLGNLDDFLVSSEEFKNVISGEVYDRSC